MRGRKRGKGGNERGRKRGKRGSALERRETMTGVRVNAGARGRLA
jgi:hypothetical protein